MNVQRSNGMLIHRPNSQGLRATVQVVSSGGCVHCRAGHRFQRRELLRCCLHVRFQNPAARARYGTYFFRGRACPQSETTTLQPAWMLGFTGQVLPRLFLPYLPRLLAVDSCLPCALDMPLSAWRLIYAPVSGLPSAPITPSRRNSFAISSARSIWLG